MKSDNVKSGMQQAPHQKSLFNALGFTEEEMERPLVGIVSSYNEIVPGSYESGQDRTQAVKMRRCRWLAVRRSYSRRSLCATVLQWVISGMKYSLSHKRI